VTDVRSGEADVWLHERLLAADDGALAEAYDTWSGLIYSLAVEITGDHAAAEDVTQDVFVRLWERPDAYDPQRGTLRSWLCMQARSRALDLTRRRRTRARYQAAAPAAGDQAEIDETVMWKAETGVVRDAVLALPAPQREAVMLAFYDGYTYREVANQLNIPEGTAKSRLRVALAAVAGRLAAEGILER
jgi:RNA polymerase sigma-70 factor (ECF subfamily)